MKTPKRPPTHKATVKERGGHYGEVPRGRRLDAINHAIGNAYAQQGLQRARRKMNPVSGGPQVKRFGIGKGGGVRHSKTTGRFI